MGNVYRAAQQRATTAGAAWYTAKEDLDYAELRLHAAQERSATGDDTAGDTTVEDQARQVAIAQAVDRARDDLEAARNTVAATARVYEQTRQDLAAARDDYDATPRGLAELGWEADAATNPGERTALEHRMQRALERMNAETDQRSRRWGTAGGRREPVRYAPPEDRSDAAAAVLADRARAGKVGATAVSHGPKVDPISGEPRIEYTVTFFRVDRDTAKVRRMPVQFRAPQDGTAPTVGGVLAHMARRAVVAEQYPNARAFIARESIPVASRTTARQEHLEGRTYSSQLRRFFGVNADRYLEPVRERPAA